jgi:hypothetical protein
MEMSPGISRQERIDLLCAEVGMLSLCHSSLPAGDASRDVSREISVRLVEINRLSQPDVPRPSSRYYTAYVFSALLVIYGLMSGAYGAVVIGALAAFFVLVLFGLPSLDQRTRRRLVLDTDAQGDTQEEPKR